MRSIGTKPEIISKYFNLLEDTLIENELMDEPCRIFNMDETGMPLDPTPPKVVSIRGTKHPISTTTGDKSQITVAACCSAGGYSMPPMVIFDRQRLKAELTKGEVPGTLYGLSKTGWMDSDLFNLWFTKHFLLYAPPTRPILLLLDGHSTHFNPVTIERAAEEMVIIFCFPPHSSHRTQPLDKGCFGPLKQYWRQECHSFLTRNPGRQVTRHEFSELFARAWFKSMTMGNIVGGFKNTGIFPFDRTALLPTESESPPPIHPRLSQRTGINYIPLFSPDPRKVSSRFENQCETTVDTSMNDLSMMDSVNDDFTDAEVQLFSRRREEGYDLADPRYELWLINSKWY